ncbi:MAG: hypothetical protein IKS31_01390 [Clostridia bacterium]|nr:hypothetical protein [Clostridia bacterium]
MSDIQTILAAYESNPSHDNIGAAMQAVMGVGNVDLLNRPQVQIGDDIATVLSVTFSAGANQELPCTQNLLVHVTSIKADGTVLTEAQLATYLTGIVNRASVSAMLDADSTANSGQGLILWMQRVGSSFTQEDYDNAEAFDEDLHLLQGAYYLQDFDEELPTTAELMSLYLLTHDGQDGAQGSTRTFDADTTSVSLPTNGSQSVSINARWTHPGQSAYDILRMDVAFTHARDYYTLAIRDSTGSVTYRTVSATTAEGQDETVEVPREAWENQSGGTLKLVFSRQAARNAAYSNIRLIITYRAKAGESTVSVATATAGSPQTVTMTNSASGVKHTVTWTYPGGISSGETSVPAGTGTASWSVPAASLPDLYEAVTDRDRATGTVTVTTLLEDGTVVGTSAYPAELIFPDSISPALTVVESTALDATGQAIHTADSSYDVIAGHTTFSVSATASGQYDATVTGILLHTPEGDVTITNGSPTVQIRTAGTWAWTVTATDSRGKTSTQGGTLTVKSVSGPVVSSLSAQRWSSGSASGHADDEGNYVKISVVTASGTPASALSLTYRIAQVGSGSQIETGSISGDTYAGSGLLITDRAYTLTVTAEDAFGQSASASMEIPSALYTIHRMAGGRGVAFGKTADKYGVEISSSWPFFVHGEELLDLTVNAAHPPGSVMLTIDSDDDPNARWPWTEWGLLGGVTIGNITAHAWVRTR